MQLLQWDKPELALCSNFTTYNLINLLRILCQRNLRQKRKIFYNLLLFVSSMSLNSKHKEQN
jgi:hypothetical protein